MAAAERGRAPGLTLYDADGRQQPLQTLGASLLEQCEPIARALDEAMSTGVYTAAVEAAGRSLANPSLTPPAKVLESMARDWSNSYSRFALNQSEKHRDTHLSRPIPPALLQEHQRKVVESWEKQREIETADQVDFETYRRQYVSQDLTAGSAEA